LYLSIYLLVWVLWPALETSSIKDTDKNAFFVPCFKLKDL
jgi:hypothetical protein